MRILSLVLFLLLAGCSSGTYKVPTKEYQQQVKTLGVLPLIVDSRSAIVHPDADAIVSLLRRGAAGQSEIVVDELRRKKGYFDVRLVPEPARILSEKLLLKAGADELGLPRGYQLNQQFLAELCKDSFVDGLLLLNLQGVVHTDKRWSRNTFEHLTTDFNDIMATATVVTADGRLLWELSGADATNVLALQYPDFDEAHFNREELVRLKFITLAGLEKTLLSPAEKEQGISGSPQIAAWLQKVIAALSPTLFR